MLAHERLDEAVLAVYGWLLGLSDDAVFAKLLELNLGKEAQSGDSRDCGC